MRIRLTALDTLFFRDGKPFNRGEETWANGIFPPPPSVIYGALRSLYFTSNPQDIGKENTSDDPTNKLVINDIQITSGDNLYYPCPLDVVVEKTTIGSNDVNHLLLNLNDTKRITSSKLEHHLSVKDNLEVETIDGYISHRGFARKYLKGQVPDDVFSLDNFLTLEPKVGIGRNNNTHVSDDGLLYRVGMIRPEFQNDNNQFLKLNIEIEFELNTWEQSIGDKGFIKLGGEAKACSYEVIPSKDKIDTEELSSNIFKICFITPTVFNNSRYDKRNDKIHGWIPSFLDENLEGEWKGVKVKLLTAAIGKPKYLGGFDMKKRKPKPMLKMVPEGSVYYFKIMDESGIKVLKDLKQPFVLIDDDEKEATISSSKKANQGFGLAYLANF
jgi:CRISPR-associated protein Cmr3